MGKRSIPELIEGLKRRDWIALAQASTIVENNYEGKEELLDYAYRTGKADCLILGITGAGGAGKSTLIDRILELYAKRGKTVGVLAVDPSSSYTGGAVLGDRIRMGRHTINENLYIRSFGSRGSLGGISQGAKDVLYLFKSYGFDVIIIESVGVGQAETDITNFVDVTTVVLAPGNGDYMQLAKAGTQEIADIFVVNKADRPEADTLYLQLKSTFDFLPVDEQPVMVRTSARENEGIEELADCFEEAAQRLLAGRYNKRRCRIRNEVLTGALQVFEPFLRAEVEAVLEDVLAGKRTPYEAACDIGGRIRILDPAKI